MKLVFTTILEVAFVVAVAVLFYGVGHDHGVQSGLELAKTKPYRTEHESQR